MTLGRLLLCKPSQLGTGNRLLSTRAPVSASPVDQCQLVRVCTILYQQQSSPAQKLHSKLSATGFDFSHEFFLQVCNQFPFSWRPVYRFYSYIEQEHNAARFEHTTVSFNKMLDVFGKSRNVDLLWRTVQEMGRRKLVDDRSFLIVVKALASLRELKKCVQIFVLMEGFGYGHHVKRLNKVVEALCKRGEFVEEAKFVILKLKERVAVDRVTYGWLVRGFCDKGDLIEASKVWNLMFDEGLEPEIEVFDRMIETLFKKNEYFGALEVFEMMKMKRTDELGLSSYKLVIDWLCKRGKIEEAKLVFDEMRKRGIELDNVVWGSLVYGLLLRRKVIEAYKLVEGLEKLDINVYHGLIKGLLKLKRPSEATNVFREMVKRGVEPIMHTYVMLLQGHMGKRGRKGHDPLVNFDTIFVGGLVKSGKSLEATKYVERTMNRGLEVPRFDYNKFLHYYSNEEGAIMFEDVGKKLRDAGLIDLADIFERYGQKMATRDRRRNRAVESCDV